MTYANDAFISVSGYSADEIVGQPHNLVRHPDMPREAFEDMWATLKDGLAWTGIVKNRRKNGDHYWVRANATPVTRDGKCVGYMSVRTHASREEVDSAEGIYSRMRQGTFRHRKLFRGTVIRTGLLSFLSWHSTMPVRWRLLGPSILSLILGTFTAAKLGALNIGQTLDVACIFSACMAIILMIYHIQIAAPLEQISKQSSEVASGSTDSVLLNRTDEIGVLSRSVNQLGLILRWVVDDVASQVGTVEHASGEIALGNSDLSDRTEKTAAALEQIAATLASVNESVSENARAATLSAGIADEAARDAKDGEAVISHVGDAMRKISDSSSTIREITGMIDGISFQTNILALNAAVEAARAGEHGRGFSVVASEVRSLATRASSAAKEIRELIEESARLVEDGVKESRQAAEAIAKITRAVAKARDLIEQISVVSREQATSVLELNHAMSHLDQATQQNAALVEQSAAAAQSLKHQARSLLAAVSVFHRGA